MKKSILLLSGLFANLTGLNYAQAHTPDRPSEKTSTVMKKWADAENEVCHNILVYSDLEEMSAQEIYDFNLLLQMISQIEDNPIEYCEALLMENMAFTKETKK